MGLDFKNPWIGPGADGIIWVLTKLNNQRPPI